MKKQLAAVFSVLLIAGVGYGLYKSISGQLQARQVITVRGLIGSEKKAFFQSPEVIEALKQHQIVVEAEKRGSRKIALSPDLKNYDFAFPSGLPAAEKIKRQINTSTTYDVFYTPMVIASWKPISQILASNGLSQTKNGVHILNMASFLKTATSDKKWRDLKGKEAYPVSRSVLLQSTDVRTSNSAAMYLSLSSYIINGEEVVSSKSAGRQIATKLAPLFLKQGFQESSSMGPFQDYLAMGMGKTPLVMVYESQIIEAALNKQLKPESVVIYPSPTIFTKHILIPISENGKKLGDVLSNDPKLQELAIKYGFRTKDTTSFDKIIKSTNLKLPSQIVNVVDPPAYEVLEAMIEGIEEKMAKTKNINSLANKP